ncbi:hypothetical protein WJX75_003492 [Coccomyxa subellipsoidea]|uniref:Uncharacterized protein n=1 Tax=Coccomyxa subellipsoidea TaxID=248742 RepID=A0ABR2YXJ9_9CHLO
MLVRWLRKRLSVLWHSSGNEFFFSKDGKVLRDRYENEGVSWWLRECPPKYTKRPLPAGKNAKPQAATGASTVSSGMQLPGSSEKGQEALSGSGSSQSAALWGGMFRCPAATMPACLPCLSCSMFVPEFPGFLPALICIALCCEKVHKVDALVSYKADAEG